MQTSPMRHTQGPDGGRRRALKAAAAGLGSGLLTGCGGGAAPAASLAASACLPGAAYAGAALHAAWPPASLPLAAAPDASLPSELAALLNARLATLLEQTGAPAISAAIGLPDRGHWRGTQGLARVVPATAASSDATPFYWGSIAKSLTAVLVLQLVESAGLKLDDRLGRWFPQLPQAELITIEQLLTHTSGLATNALDARGQVAQTPQALVQAAAATPGLFCPGSSASYSNTAYALLALIIEAVEQQAFHEVLQRRIAQPLGLQQLRALRPGEDAPPGLASPHAGRIPKADPGTWSRLGAGNIIASAADIVQFWQALLAGRLLAVEAVRRQSARLYPLQDAAASTPGQARLWAGQGVMLMAWTDALGRPRNWLGHLGGIPTANATLAFDPLVQASIAVAVNSEVSSTAVANALLQVVLDWRG